MFIITCDFMYINDNEFSQIKMKNETLTKESKTLPLCVYVEPRKQRKVFPVSQLILNLGQLIQSN